MKQIPKILINGIKIVGFVWGKNSKQYKKVKKAFKNES